MELSSANGICCQAVMDKLSKEHRVVCLTNREYGKEKKRQKEDVALYTVKPRLTYRIREWLDSASMNQETKRIIGAINWLLNKVALGCAYFSWPQISKSYTKRIYRTANKICAEKNIDVIVPVYTQIDTLIAATKIKKKNPQMIYIPYFLDSLSGGYGPKRFSKEWIRRRGIKWERKLLANADGIVMMQSSRKYYETYCQNEPYFSKIRFLDLPLLDPKSIDHSKEESKINQSKTIEIVYIGTIPAHIRDPRIFLDVFEKVTLDNVSVTFVGTNTCPEVFREYCRRDGRIKMHPFVDHSEALYLMGKADFLLNLGNNDTSMTPSKIFEYMSFGKPILSTAPIKNEPSIPYLKKYPLSFIVDSDECPKNVAREMEKFILRYKGKSIDSQYLKNELYLNTPQAFKDFIVYVKTNTAEER